MIKSLEIKNFESHSHTVLEGFSSGFNLIRGPSNSGKSSILRALKLVCFNEFTPDCVRINAKACEVKITTDKGTVKVKRGEKINEWEVTPNGEKTKCFSKIGTELLSDVIEVTGMQPVKLGNIEFNANIMNQLEGHFMLDELEGQNASGSVRAQIVDEISGLSGIEGLIREVSLDNLRNGKEIKRSEKDIKDIQEKMHNRTEIEKERGLLNTVQGILSKQEESQTLREKIQTHIESSYSVKTTISETKKKIKELKDFERAGNLLGESSTKFFIIEDMRQMIFNHNKETRQFEEKQKRIDAIPNLSQIEKMLKKADDLSKQRSDADNLSKQANGESKKILNLKESIAAIADPSIVLGILNNLSEKVDDFNVSTVVVNQYNKIKRKYEQSKQGLLDTEGRLFKAEGTITALLAEVDICPFCESPINECEEHSVPEPPVRKAMKRKVK